MKIPFVTFDYRLGLDGLRKQQRIAPASTTENPAQSISGAAYPPDRSRSTENPSG